MGKHKITILTILGCIVIFLIVIFLSLQQDSEKLASDNNNIVQSDNIIISILSKEDEYNQKVRAEILKGHVGGNDELEMRNFLPSEYEFNDSSPIIEFRSFERKLDGSIEPFYLKMLGLLSIVPKGERLTGADFGVDGYGLRLGLTGIKEKFDEDIYLAWDTEYRAIGIYFLPEDQNNQYLISEKTPEIRFRTPKSLAPGEIYRVDLILVDRNKEKDSQ